MILNLLRSALAYLGLGLFNVAGLAQGLPNSREILPVMHDLCTEMRTTKVLNPGAPVGCERLRRITFSYLNFSGEVRTDGELIIMDAVADHVLRIFNALREKAFPIAKAHLMNHYLGNDDDSMADNTTSAFNDRPIAGGRTTSIHAYGLAIDLNPIQNPFISVSKGRRSISPKSGAEYEDRKNARPGMAEPIVDVFADNGFPVWGGRWSNPIDYQHFQVSRDLANQLARNSPNAAKLLFESSIAEYHKCKQRLGKGCVIGVP
jgi:hypothetical protein